jgi:hypothetical protein
MHDDTARCETGEQEQQPHQWLHVEVKNEEYLNERQYYAGGAKAIDRNATWPLCTRITPGPWC